MRPLSSRMDMQALFDTINFRKSRIHIFYDTHFERPLSHKMGVDQQIYTEKLTYIYFATSILEDPFRTE